MPWLREGCLQQRMKESPTLGGLCLALGIGDKIDILHSDHFVAIGLCISRILSPRYRDSLVLTAGPHGGGLWEGSGRVLLMVGLELNSVALPHVLFIPCLLTADSMWPVSLQLLPPCVLHHDGLHHLELSAMTSLFFLKLIVSGILAQQEEK